MFYSTKIIIPAGSRIVCPKCKAMQATLLVNMCNGMTFKSEYFKFVDELKTFYSTRSPKDRPMISYCHQILWGENIKGLFVDFKGWIPGGGEKKPAISQQERFLESGPKHFVMDFTKKIYNKLIK